MYHLVSLPAWLLCLIFVITGMVISVSGLLLVKKFAPSIPIEGEQVRPAATICSIIGSLFAILIAFVVITVWQRYNEQYSSTVQEASVLGNLYRDSRGLGPEKEKEVQRLIKKYTHSLINNAWPALKNGQESKVSWVDFNNLYVEIISHRPKDDKERIIYSRLIQHLNVLSDFRRLRILNSNLPIIPDVLWYILLSGAVISIGFTYLFQIGTLPVQMIITAIHATVISLIFFVIVLLNYPYRSSIRVKPKPIEILLKDVYPIADAGRIYVK